MIETLYPVFRKWSEKGSVYIVSDTHFEDSDCKLMDPEAHRKYCGVPNEGILSNLRLLMDSGKAFTLRVPLIPGITDTDDNLTAIAAFAGDAPVELLPYNAMAGAKYPSVGRDFPLPALLRQSPDELDRMKSLFRNARVRK